jgi:hypothetical protein
MGRILSNSAGRASLACLLLGGLASAVFVPAAAAKDLILAWESSASTNVVGYRLCYGTASRKYDHAVEVGGDLQVTLPDLAQGTTYYFAVKAYDNRGLESPPSNEVSYSVPRPPAGSYNGLFHEKDEIHTDAAGCFTVSLTARGSYTGRLQSGSRRHSFSGRLGPQGDAINVVHRPDASAWTVELHVGTDARVDEISGRVIDGLREALLVGDRAVFHARTRPAPYAGTYTLTVPGQEDDPTVPAGIGYGTVRMGANGVARFAGSLADGTKVSQSVPLSKHGLWPFYVPLYAGQGLVMGWIAFTNEMDSDLVGTVHWIKPSNPRAQHYAAGFTNECRTVGSVYAAASGPVNAALNPATARVVFSGGNLLADFTNSVALGFQGKVSNLSGTEMQMRFSLPTGVFRGKAVDPNSGQLYPFSGVLLHRLSAGYGFLLGPDRSSRVTVAP